MWAPPASFYELVFFFHFERRSVALIFSLFLLSQLSEGPWNFFYLCIKMYINLFSQRWFCRVGIPWISAMGIGIKPGILVSLQFLFIFLVFPFCWCWNHYNVSIFNGRESGEGFGLGCLISKKFVSDCFVCLLRYWYPSRLEKRLRLNLISVFLFPICLMFNGIDE